MVKQRSFGDAPLRRQVSLTMVARLSNNVGKLWTGLPFSSFLLWLFAVCSG